MNKGVARKWADALRSGEYQQAQSVLTLVTEDGEKDCCLGVLCKLALQDGVKLDIVTMESEHGLIKTYNGDEALPPTAVREWAEFARNAFGQFGDDVSKYADLNDDKGLSFAEIADIIEKDYLGEEVK